MVAENNLNLLFQMKLDKPCIPWYFPKNDTSSLRMCSPWEAMDFRKIMDTTPVNFYSHCLTDCSGIIYKASLTAAPFSRCDFKNIGVSDLCDFDIQLNPTIWGQSVMDQYGDEVEKAKKKFDNSGGPTLSSLIVVPVRLFFWGKKFGGYDLI